MTDDTDRALARAALKNPGVVFIQDGAAIMMSSTSEHVPAHRRAVSGQVATVYIHRGIRDDYAALETSTLHFKREKVEHLSEQWGLSPRTIYTAIKKST
jgi:hypothetical protein